MFWCEKCRIWEHEKCLAKAIRKEYLENHPPETGKERVLNRNPKITFSTNTKTGEVLATIGAAKTKVSPEKRSARGKKDMDDDITVGDNVVPVTCLKCKTQLS